MNAPIVRICMLTLLGAGLSFSGCSTTRPVLRSPQAEDSADEALSSGRHEIGRAELWAQRCSQCHYARSADSFTPQQWEIIMLHMRVRANLATEEHQTILEFLQSGR